MPREGRGLPVTVDNGATVQVRFGFGLGLICNNIGQKKRENQTEKNAAKRDRKKRRQKGK